MGKINVTVSSENSKCKYIRIALTTCGSERKMKLEIIKSCITFS